MTTQQKIFDIFLNRYSDKVWHKELKNAIGISIGKPDVSDIYDFSVLFYARPDKYPRIYNLITKFYGKGHHRPIGLEEGK